MKNFMRGALAAALFAGAALAGPLPTNAAGPGLGHPSSRGRLHNHAKRVGGGNYTDATGKVRARRRARRKLYQASRKHSRSQAKK